MSSSGDDVPLNKLRIGPLTNVGKVASELGRLYRRVAVGRVSSIEGYRMAAILNVLRQCLESGMIEQRLEELESKANGNRGLPPLIDYKPPRSIQ
jgi:hypothetical protein